MGLHTVDFSRRKTWPQIDIFQGNFYCTFSLFYHEYRRAGYSSRIARSRSYEYCKQLMGLYRTSVYRLDTEVT